MTMLRRGEQSLPNHTCLYTYMFIAIETFGSLAFMCKDIYFEAFLDRAKSAFNQSSLLSAFDSLKHSFLEKFVAFFYVLELTELLAFAAWSFPVLLLVCIVLSTWLPPRLWLSWVLKPWRWDNLALFDVYGSRCFSMCCELRLFLHCRLSRWRMPCSLATRKPVKVLIPAFVSFFKERFDSLVWSVWQWVRFDDSLLCFVHIDVCSGGWEYRYQKPFATATFLVCVDQTVSGLEMDMSPVGLFRRFSFSSGRTRGKYNDLGKEWCCHLSVCHEKVLVCSVAKLSLMKPAAFSSSQFSQWRSHLFVFFFSFVLLFVLEMRVLSLLWGWSLARLWGALEWKSHRRCERSALFQVFDRQHSQWGLSSVGS